jgi:hypothetical protein
MDYRDNPQHRVGVNIKVVEFYSAFWTDFAPPLTGSAPLAVAETASDAYYDIFNDQFSSRTEREALGASARNTRTGATQKAVGTLLNTSVGVAERYA